MSPPCSPGRILHVDLSAEKVWEEPVPEDWYRLYVGGRGLVLGTSTIT